MRDPESDEQRVSAEYASSPEHRVGRLHYDYRSVVPEVLGYLILGAIAFPHSWPLRIVGILGVILGAAGIVIQARHQVRLTEVEAERDRTKKDFSNAVNVLRTDLAKMRDENEQLGNNNQALVSGLDDMIERSLVSVTNELGLDGAIRISLYVYRGKSKTFQGIARFSPLPTYSDFVRDVYASDQGCIGRALANGECILRDMPDPSPDQSMWVTHQYQKTGLDTRTSEKIRMKSREIGAFAIGEPSRVGVVVVESERTDVLDFDAIRSLVAKESRHLAEMLKIMERNSEDPRDAAKDGF